MTPHAAAMGASQVSLPSFVTAYGAATHRAKINREMK